MALNILRRTCDSRSVAVAFGDSSMAQLQKADRRTTDRHQIEGTSTGFTWVFLTLHLDSPTDSV